jgi:hypothetical protein
VHSRVAVHIDVQRGHSHLKQNPDNFMMALVTSPVEGGVLAHLASVFRLDEWVVGLVLAGLLQLLLLVALLLVQVGSAGIVFN